MAMMSAEIECSIESQCTESDLIVLRLCIFFTFLYICVPPVIVVLMWSDQCWVILLL